MQKQIEVTGPRGTFKGTVDVFLEQMQHYVYHNPSLHEEETRTRRVTMIRTYVQNRVVDNIAVIDNLKLLPTLGEFEDKVKAALTVLANQPVPQDELKEQLKQLGYE